MRGRAAAIAGLALMLASAPGLAQTVGACDWRGQAAMIPEPWEENSRTFANGAVRIALSDPGEPPCCSASLIVLVPGEIYGRSCFIVRDEEIGWWDVDIAGVTAQYDPARGLLLSVPVVSPHPLGGADRESARVIALRVNQAEGSVTLE
ncbi:MAG TPA: hypothetical protein VMM59_03565 [Thermohalobaculum sp.]|nr:hypothetical protein [Thermohalobaculum sp.]